MVSSDNCEKEVKEAREQGVFALNPDDVTTPIRMAAFAQASNAREAKEVAAEVEAAVKLGSHQLLTVGEFFRRLRERKQKQCPTPPKMYLFSDDESYSLADLKEIFQIKQDLTLRRWLKKQGIEGCGAPGRSLVYSGRVLNQVIEEGQQPSARRVRSASRTRRR